MKLIKPDHVFKNVLSTNTVPKTILKLGITNVIIVIDTNVKNYTLDNLLESFSCNLNVLLLFPYPGGEPTTYELNKFLMKISRIEYQAIIGIGGGSTLDFAKAASVLSSKELNIDSSSYQGINFEVDFKKTCICIPTTAGSGAEATKSAVMFNPKTNTKRGINHLRVLPDIVFLIPKILDNLPGKFFYPSLFDGVTHAYESLIGKSSNKKTYKLAEKSLSIYGTQISDNYSKEIYHEKVLEASFLAGQAICNSETGPIHALSYPISEQLKLSHGQAVSVILPKILQFYKKVNIELVLPLVKFLGFNDFESLVEKIEGLNKQYGVSSIKLDKNFDLDSLASRSMELKGAIKNSPIDWTWEHSRKVYKDIFKF
jgi:alcohol dehydrogenase class IV